MRRTAGTIDDLLAGAESIEPMTASDGKSGASIERVTIAGTPYVLKQVRFDDDWIMRVTGDRDLRPLQLWEAGVYDELPSCIDHAVVGMGLDDPTASRSTARLAILMRDVGSQLVPEGDEPVPEAQHRSFLRHLAELHAAFWGWRDELGLLSVEGRYRWFAPGNLVAELGRDDCGMPVRLADEGWRRFAVAEPELQPIVGALHDDPAPLVRGLASAPSTLLHGDVKLGNLGSTAEGRTILIDWALTGAGPACAELVYYLMLNCDRLPESKERAIDAYRDALERHGVVTTPWWDRQLGLATLGGVVQFGWEKALGEGEEAVAERRWWCGRASAARAWL